MKVSLFGTGLMGQPMALKLLQSGHQITAYNRTAAKLADVEAAGIAVTTEPAAAIQASDCLILMLADATAIEQTLLSATAKPLLGDRAVIQMGTIAPAQSRAIGEAVVAAGGNYLEAPVLGSIPQVKAGSLQIMVGGTEAQFSQWSPLLQSLGQPMHIGPVGTAAATKLAMNQLIGALTAGFAQSLALVQQEGIETEKFMAIVRESALYAPTFDKKLDRMLNRSFDHPNFPTKHLLKDMNLFVEAAKAAGIEAELTKSVSQIAEQAIAAGLAEQDYSALYQAVNPPADR
ncbi:NAD(P)-dependent oxidoreductase [Sphaerothrix gracilis]|uniref:NAD(P)-dependent oxidoreductase n=1 Tax=Sphaerothrix gracilis TaxID=3151835 RepID=UPI0031FC1723